MKTSCIKYAVVLSLLTFLVAPAAFCQDADKQATQISIGPGPAFTEIAALPETEALVTVYLSTGEGIVVGSVNLSLTFPSKLLSFVGAEPSFLTQAVGAQIKTDVKSSGGDSVKSTLELVVSTLETPDHGFIPDGPIANLAFKVANGATLGSDIPLNSKATATTNDIPPKKVERVVTTDGKITVQAPVIPACFFYMH